MPGIVRCGVEWADAHPSQRARQGCPADVKVYDSSDPSIQIPGRIDMGELFQPMHLLVILIISVMSGVIFVVPFWQIFKKAGLPAPLSLLMVFPFVNLIMIYVLAFSTWNVVPRSSPSGI
jgi:hypothetical protein